MESISSNLFGLFCGGFVIFIFFAASVFIIISSIRARKKAEASQAWPSTQGQIESTEIKQNTSTDSDGYTSTTYKPLIMYSYSVMGQPYQSDRIAFGFTQSYGKTAKAQEVLNKYPLNAPVNVFYDPDNPAEAVLERKVGSKAVGLVLGIIFLVLSLCVGFPLLVYFAYTSFL